MAENLFSYLSSDLDPSFTVVDPPVPEVKMVKITLPTPVSKIQGKTYTRPVITLPTPSHQANADNKTRIIIKKDIIDKIKLKNNIFSPIIMTRNPKVNVAPKTTAVGSTKGVKTLSETEFISLYGHENVS